MTAPPPLGARRFYGWRIVGVAFLVDFIAVGFFFYSYGVFFRALAGELGGGERLGVSLGISLSNVIGAALAPWIGRSLDRRSIRTIMILGAVFVSIGFACLSQIRTLWQFYLVLGTLFAVGMSLMGGMASSKLVANWFVERRGTALGIATMGVSLSGLLMPTVATWLIANLGWRGGFGVYALCTAVVVIPLVARFVVNRPEEMGLRPDGAAPPPPAPTGGPGLEDERLWSTRAILRSRNFWAIAIPFSLSFSALSAILTHLVPYAQDMGIDGYRAAWILSCSAGAGIFGKVVFGHLVDRIDARIAIWASFGTQMIGLLLIMGEPVYARLLVGGVVFGLGMGGVIPLQGAVIGAAFGRLSFGKVMGLLRPASIPIHAVGIPMAGWIFDTTGSYAIAFQAFLGIYALASLGVAGVRIAPTSRAAAAARASESQAGFA